MTDTKQLHALAAHYGLQLRYSDIHGTTREASLPQIVHTLRMLGAPIGESLRLDEDLRNADRRAWSELAPPVSVAWDGVGVLRVRLPSYRAEEGYRLTVRCESGETFERSGSMADAAVRASKTVGGDTFVERWLPLPEGLPWGYHDATLEIWGFEAAYIMVISAPRRSYDPVDVDPSWGLFAPLYALHSERSLSTGDFTDLENVTRWVGERGGAVVGTLPLLATFLDGAPDGSRGPFEPSPYAPASRLAWNELYLDIESIPEFTTGTSIRKTWSSRSMRGRIAALRSSDQVDYAEQMGLMREVLEPMSTAAWANPSTAAELEGFAKAHPTIADYARFRSATATLGKPWGAWPVELRDGGLDEGAYDLEIYRYHVYVQYNVHLQLQRLSTCARDTGLGLYLDLPVGVHPDGYDIWKYRSVFACGLSTGAPPDALFSGGQNWAFPPLHPRGTRDDRHRYFRAVIQNHLRYAGVLRIDHVMGLQRIYSIPQGASATEGMYINYDYQELYAILSLESHRSRTILIGENLGVVPPEVEEAMSEHGIAGMHVVQYEASPNPDAALPPASAGEIASLNTHDMPPFRAFWEGRDSQLRCDLGWIDEAAVAFEQGERKRLTDALATFLGRRDPMPQPVDWRAALRAMLVHLGRSRTRLVLLNLEDLWGETRSQNVPGTFREYPNWRHRARHAFEAWITDATVLGFIDALREARKTAHIMGNMRYDVSRIAQDDLHYFNEGTHRRIEQFLGAHEMTVDGVEGTSFSVWAPSADYVSVVGDFNGWDRGSCPLRARGESGIWEGFVEGVAAGDLYKFHIAGPGFAKEKTDPVGQRYEVPPRTASIVSRVRYSWSDAQWMGQRGDVVAQSEPMSIYEVHLGSWMRVPEEDHRWLTYREIGTKLVEYVTKLGFTHVEFLPLMEHPFYPSWGYQTTGYFAPTSRYGSPEDFMFMVDTLHQAGIGVLLDWVPSHFPSDDHALALFDGTHLYEHADPRQGYHPDWKSSIFNYGRFEVQSFLVSSARYWLERFHADGLRVDAVASMLYLDYSRNEGEWIPNKYGGRENLEAIDFIRKVNTTVYGSDPPGAQSIAEESTAWGAVSRPAENGGLGFGFKWDMGWMHDTLQYFGRDCIHRQHHQHELTFRMIYAFNENFVLPLSHDEVVHGKGSLIGRMPGDRWQRFANLRALYGYMFGQPGKKLLFQGCEFGQEREWNHNESLDWHLLANPMHAGVQAWVAELNRLYRSEPALYEYDCDPRGFEWIDFSDHASSVLHFLRKGETGRPVLVSCNLTPVPRPGYRVGVPEGGAWVELANSDAKPYGGSGVVNAKTLKAEEIGHHGRPWSIEVHLPPLAVVFFAPEGRE